MQLTDKYKEFQDLYKEGFLFDLETKTYYPTNAQKNVPEQYESWEKSEEELSLYLENRLDSLGIKPKQNEIKLLGSPNAQNGEETTEKVFIANKFGDIEILQYSLSGKVYTNGGESAKMSDRERYCYQTRLHPIHARMKGAKYDFSKAKNYPFWHKSLIEAFKEKTAINRLTVTEGQIKAFKASLEGIPCTGFTSITHYKDSKTKTIHPEIAEFIRVCNVQEFVILWDGDCRDISENELKDKKDISKRPKNFYTYASNIKTLLQKFFPQNKLKIYFATIRSQELEHNSKGIDDLLCDYSDKKEDILNDYNKIGKLPCNYFDWVDITKPSGLKELYNWFGLDSITTFFRIHREEIQYHDFIFFGSTFEVKNELPVKKIDANVKNYLRVGTDYFKEQKKPSIQNGEAVFNKVLTPWKEGAIKQDHGKDTINHIEKYEGFVNEPQHMEYQKTIFNYYNMYNELTHQPQKGEFPCIKILLKHLFTEQYAMILDYITIAFKHPKHPLPVICLVSKKNATGKSTFIYLMSLIFQENLYYISSNDFSGEFNAHWVPKLFVACEETMLHKPEAYEKIKSLSTAKKLSVNQKGTAQNMIEVFLKFIFCSNHEDNFIKINNEDSRLWIRNPSTITQKIDDFDSKIADEIPFFIDFIMNREIEYQRKDRLWFDPKDFQTDAFKRLVQNSEAGCLKEIRHWIEEQFELMPFVSEIKASSTQLKTELGLRDTPTWISKQLKETWKLKQDNKKFSFNKFVQFEKGEQEHETRGRHFIFPRSMFVNDERKKEQPKCGQIDLEESIKELENA